MEEVKLEPRGINSPGLFVRNASTALTPPEPDGNDATWKKCGAENLPHQVEIKELSVKIALRALRNLEDSLKEHLSRVKAGQKWLDRIALIRDAKKNCEVRVGFVGQTGTGKSTLVNALLGFKNLVPVSYDRACTSAVVEIAWNPRSDPDALFCAEVQRISEAEWKTELETLFRDFEQLSQPGDDEAGGSDIDGEHRVTEMMSKITSVYPEITDSGELKKWSVEKLMEHQNVNGLLGKDEKITCPNLQTFRTKIKPFIDSKEGPRESFAQWPLVRLVKLKVRSKVLEDGIVLVDIPGTMDSNAARSSLADWYQKNLALTCVLSRAGRAPSDKGAHELLTRATQRNLLMDGQYHSGGLAFIVTQTDGMLDANDYIDSHPDLKESLAEEFEKENRLKGWLVDQKVDKVRTEELRLEFWKSTKELFKQLKTLDPSYGKAPTRKRKRAPETGKAAPQEFRKLENQYIKAEQERIRAGDKLADIQENIQKIEGSIWHVDCRKRQACIKNRNDLSKEMIKENHRLVVKEMQLEQWAKPLEVLCCSATMFFNHEAGIRDYQGFPRLRHTGVPKLRRWLVETTLASREENAMLFLADVEGLEQSIMAWAKDTSADHRMPVATRTLLEEDFEVKTQDFLDRCGILHERTIKDFDKLVHSGIYKILPHQENVASRDSRKTVESWCDRVQWSTHLATNKRRGKFKSHNGRSYDWNDDLTNDYLSKKVVTAWNQTFNITLPINKVTYELWVIELLEEYSRGIISSAGEICPEISESLQDIEESISQKETVLKKNSVRIFDEIRDVTKESHRLIKPQIKRFWTPTYEECGADRGAGHYNRNKSRHNVLINNKAKKMFRGSTKEIEGAFNRLTAILPQQLQEGPEEVTTSVRELFNMMLDNHTLTTVRTSERSEVNAKKKLQASLATHFGKLHKDWVVKLDLEEDEVEEEVDLHDLNLDDLVVRDEDEGDEDYEDGDSDGDE